MYSLKLDTYWSNYANNYFDNIWSGGEANQILKYLHYIYGGRVDWDRRYIVFKTEKGRNWFVLKYSV